MKNQLLILALQVSLGHCLLAQAPSVFDLSPNPSDTVVTLDVLDAPAYARIKNLTADSIFIKWERHIIQLSPGVLSAICDPDRCWYVSTNSHTFGLAPDSSGQLTVHFVQQVEQASSGIVYLKLRNQQNAADSLTAIYTYSTLTGTGELPEAKVKLFPNPTTDFFTLENAEAVAAIRLFTLDGQELARFENKADNTYSLVNQLAGNYVLALEDKNGRLFQAVELIKR